MQSVAWLLSVLVIGINLFFVIEYVVSYKSSEFLGVTFRNMIRVAQLLISRDQYSETRLTYTPFTL